LRVLIVEDEARTRGLLERGLREALFHVEGVGDATAAESRAVAGGFDAILLDVMLPDRDGFTLCRRLRTRGIDTPILLLTGRNGVTDRVHGLNAGADDYIAKPFAFEELVARIQALGRRSRPAAPPALERAGIRLDPSRQEVFRDGRYVQLARKEFGLLAELLRANGTIVSAERLLEKVWDEHTDPFTNTVRVTLMKLRRKLGDPPVIETVPGVGYRIP
jgi:DNA-binding response OmpR family regulator